MSEFEKLSRNLDVEQRQDLLNKINKPNGATENADDFDNTTYTESISNSHKQAQLEIAKKEYKMLSFWEKLSIIITSLISGHQKEDILIQKKINKIKRKIQTINPTLINFEKKQLTNQFANYIINLYRPITDLQNVMTNYFDNEQFFDKFLKTICERNFSEKQKIAYNDCLPQNFRLDPSAVLDTFSFTKEKDARINNFLSSITVDSLSTFIDDLNCYEKLMRVIHYDFRDLLLEFSINSVTAQTNHKNVARFQNISARLEHLDAILSSCDFSTANIMFLSDLVEFTKKNPVNMTMEVLKNELTVQDVQRIYMILDNITEFNNKVPLTLMIQYFKKDYLYEPRKAKSRNTFLDKYKLNMKTYFNKLWDDYLVELKRKNLNKLIENIYQDFHFDTLPNFNTDFYKLVYSNFNFKLTGVYQLNHIFYFINKIYKTGLEAVVNKILIDGDFPNDQNKFHLTGVYHTLGNNLAKIKEFDGLFAPDQDLYKRLNFYIDKGSSADSSASSSVKTLIKDIDSRSMTIVRDVINSMTNLQIFFNSLMTVQSRGERQIKNLEMINIGAQNNNVYVEKTATTLTNFFKVYKYIENIY